VFCPHIFGKAADGSELADDILEWKKGTKTMDESLGTVSQEQFSGAALMVPFWRSR
jgi:hypothetical protein